MLHDASLCMLELRKAETKLDNLPNRRTHCYDGNQLLACCLALVRKLIFTQDGVCSQGFQASFCERIKCRCNACFRNYRNPIQSTPKKLLQNLLDQGSGLHPGSDLGRFRLRLPDSLRFDIRGLGSRVVLLITRCHTCTWAIMGSRGPYRIRYFHLVNGVGACLLF